MSKKSYDAGTVMVRDTRIMEIAPIALGQGG